MLLTEAPHCAHVSILSTMDQYLTHEVIQETGCEALFNLMLNGYFIVDAVMRCIYLMNSHYFYLIDRFSSYFVCLFLYSLEKDMDTRMFTFVFYILIFCHIFANCCYGVIALAINQDLLMKEPHSVYKTILSAMTTHSTNANIQYYACAILRSLSMNGCFEFAIILYCNTYMSYIYI